MSNHKNYRREEEQRTEHGPRYESHNPGKGCNSTHVAKGRKRYKKTRTRKERRDNCKACIAEMSMEVEEEVYEIPDSEHTCEINRGKQ